MLVHKHCHIKSIYKIYVQVVHYNCSYVTILNSNNKNHNNRV